MSAIVFEEKFMAKKKACAAKMPVKKACSKKTDAKKPVAKTLPKKDMTK
ncbi:MAG: hypothetical protein QM743_06300 [Chitinophagaceae bacterium]